MSSIRSLGRLTLILCLWISGPLILARPFPSIPAEEMSLPEGTLIRLRGDTDVYVIQDGRKCYIPDPETVNAEGYDAAQVVEVDQATFDDIMTGIPVPSVKPLFRYHSSP